MSTSQPVNLYADSRFVTTMTPDHFEVDEKWRIKNKDCAIVLFYADWCGHCKRSVDLINSVAEYITFKDTYAFNCHQYTEHTDDIKSSSPGLINGYPTLVLYNNGEPQQAYEKSMSYDADIPGEMERIKGEIVDYAKDMCASTN